MKLWSMDCVPNQSMKGRLAFFPECAHLVFRRCDDLHAALLCKEREAQTSPFPGRTYPAGSVIGMPSAV